jgi:hypothetical protein
MKTISASIAFFGFIAGIIAAWYWYKSTQIDVPDIRHIINGNVTINYVEWMEGSVRALRDVSELNEKAAIATAISVFANGAAAVLSTFLPRK